MEQDKITVRQMMCTAFVLLCSPIIRLLPTGTSELAGRGAWVSVLVGGVLCALYVWLLSSFLSAREDGEGAAELIIKCIGRPLGLSLCAAVLLWLLIYSGFVLRISSERMLSTVFDNGSLLVLSIITASAALTASLGKVKSIVRTAEVMLLVITAVLWVTLFFSLENLEVGFILPVRFTGEDGINILKGALVPLNVMAVAFYGGFLYGDVKKQPEERKISLRWCGYTVLSMFCITFCTLGTISVPLIEKMQNPFFIMIRNISAFGVLERIESVVIAIWVFADFIMLSVLMKACAAIYRAVFKRTEGKAFYYICIAAVIIFSFVISPTAFALDTLSKRLVPFVNVAVTVGVFPIVYLTGKIRKRI